MSFHTDIELETAWAGPASDEGSPWGLCLSEPVYDVNWVDASVVENLQRVNAMPPSERQQRVQDFLEEGIMKLRDSVRFSCDIYQGFPAQGESVLSNICPIAEAMRRVSAWEQQLQQRVYAQEIQLKDLLPTESRGIDNHDSLNDQPMEVSSQDPDPQPMRSPSVSSDNQPMDISSGSSDDEGGIIFQQIPKPTGLPFSGPSPSPAAPKQKKKKYRPQKKERERERERVRNAAAAQSATKAPASGGQAQARPNYAGSLKPHPSLPPRPPTSFGRSWGS